MKSQNKLTNDPIVDFSHNFHFMVTNFVKITSMRIENFRASLGRRPGGEQIYIWGRYNLIINFRINQGEKEISRSKEFPRGFSFALNDCVLPVEEIEEMDENLHCQFSFSHGVSPISFGLLPFLSKINYIPFKIDVTVNGSIVNVPLEADMKKTKLLKGEINCEDSSKIVNVQTEKPLLKLQEEKLEEETSHINNDHDLISRAKKKKTSVPSPNPQYYKKHQLYYDYFFNNRPQKKENKFTKKN